MFAFIDESGDPGLNVDQGASPTFAVAMVSFRNELDMRDTQDCLAALALSLNGGSEFKFNKLDNDRRRAFFAGVRDCRFTVSAVVVEKRKVVSADLRTSPLSFHRFSIGELIKNETGVLRNARIVIDGKADRSFSQALQSYLKTQASSQVVKSVKFRDSRKDKLLQLADMSVGGIARAFKPNASHADQWMRELERNGQLGTVTLLR